jgi:hypothetical protein
MRQAKGMSMRCIASTLGVAVSSVSRWTRDIELTELQTDALRAGNPIYDAQVRGQEGRSRSARLIREAAQRAGRERAAQWDALHIQGCMLYWAEGSKGRNVAALTNSDPEMLDLFVRFLRESYDVPDSKLALSVNCHLGNGLDVHEIEDWWLQRLSLPSACLRASIVNRASAASRGRRGHVLPLGTARVSAYSVLVVQSIYGAIQEYGGFDRPGWLG